MKLNMAKIILLFFSFAILASCGGSDSITGDGSDSDGTDTATAAYIDVKASPNLVGTKSTSEISVTILDDVGDPVADVLVEFNVSADNSVGATMGIGVAKTGSDGVATLTYTAGETGGVEDTVSVSGAGLAGSVKIGVQTAVADIASLTLIADPPSPIFVAGAGEIDLNIAAIDTNNSGVADQAVSLVLVGDGSLDGASYASVTTDGQGAATQSFTVPTRLNTGGATITAQVVSSSGTKTTTLPLSFINAAATNIELSASPTSIGLQDTSSIRAVVRDQYGNPVPNENLTFTVDGTSTSTNPTFTDAGGYSAATGSATTDASGIATIDYTADATVSGTDSIIVANGAAVPVQNTIDITIDAVSTSIASVTVNALSSTITADGTSGTALQATVKDTDGQPMEGVTVDFSSSAGTLSASTADTNASGVAQVTLTSGTSLATAYITTSAGGYSAYTSVDFVSGPLATGVITAQPSSLPADGISTSTITVALQDAYGHPVADGTTVSLLQEMSGITDATVTPSSTSTTNGRATFTVTAASEAGTDTFYLFQNDTISLTMTYGAGTTAGDPASIQVSSDRSQITVAGVGREETATVTLKVLDGTGSPIPDETYNNVRVSLVTKPNAGEFISGTTNPLSPAPVDSVATGSIEIYTKSGQTSFGIQSGTLPGIVEILVEVIDDVGNTIISAVVPQIVIASGPAHSIVFAAPYNNAIVDLGNGIYQRRGSVAVSDRYGNAVPDGTVVNLGMIDSVIAQGSDGITTALSDEFTADVTDLAAAYVMRNGVSEFIEKDDRVLLLNAEAADKGRFAAGAASGTALTVQKVYTDSASSLDFIIGTTYFSATIAGGDCDGTELLTTGYVQTSNGIADICITYPATEQTILNGCRLSASDTRTTPADSGDVYVVGSVNDTGATTITDMFCFSSITGWALTDSLGGVPLNDSDTVILTLSDGGQGIPLPFQEIDAAVNLVIDAASTMTVTATDPCTTNSEGNCTATITVGGTPVSGDKATVTYSIYDGTDIVSTEISIEIP